MILKIQNFIKEKISDKAMVIIGISLLCIYYFVGLLSYITYPIKSIYKMLVSTSILAIFLRAFLCLLVVLYSIIIVIKYKPKIKWNWLIIFSFSLLMTLVSILISPMTYEYLYVESLYKVVHAVRINPGLPKTIVMFLSSIADFTFAFCILFILPNVINDKRKLLFLLLPIIVICLAECCYSFLVERDCYLYMLSHPDDPFGGYGNEVGASFGNKEDWGAFLMISISSSVASIIFLGKSKKELILKILIGLCIIVFSVFVLLSLCKTAILALLLFSCILIFGVVNYFHNNYKKLFIFSCIFLVIVFAFIICLFATGGLGISVLSKFINYFQKLIIERSGSAIEGRSALWLNYLENVRGYNLFFGMGKTYVNAYTRSLVKSGQSLIHNGFAFFFAAYGLFGFLILISLILIILKNIIHVWNDSKILVFVLLAIFSSSLIFMLAEAEVLVVSSSTPIFVYNLLLVILPAGIKYKNNKRMEEKLND